VATVLTMGSFDLLHPGHVGLLRRCRAIAHSGGRVVVAVNTDDFIAHFKDRRPVMAYAERATMVEAVRYVDQVVENDGADQAKLIEMVKPDWLVVGADWATKDYMAQLGITYEWLAEHGIALIYLVHGQSAAISSTQVRARMAES